MTRAGVMPATARAGRGVVGSRRFLFANGERDTTWQNLQGRENLAIANGRLLRVRRGWEIGGAANPVPRPPPPLTISEHSGVV